ncbi:hypothetical protein ABW20_dc0106003 [Dactylellina cionopaga]|nr:hypothetical protein ABW20_dc0106003 [Dactylellina cionopaga]
MIQTIPPEPMPETNGSANGVSLDDFYLDIFGQQGTPIYTQICLCYTLPDESPTWYTSVIEILQAGLERLSTSFPWIAGQIVNEYIESGNSGVYRIEYLDDTPRLVVKDLRGDTTVPTMKALRESNFPFRLLDESLVAPRKTLILPGTEVQQACLVQATFIEGGLLFTFLGHHAAMDGVGEGQLMNLLNKACRNEPFTPEELEIGNAPRKDIIPLLDDTYQPGSELSHQLFTPPSGPPSLPRLPKKAPKLTPPKFTWAYFIFNQASLNRLKAAACNSLASGYISTDDALTALIWQAVVRARLPHLDPSDKVTLARAVDVRSYLKLSPIYPGTCTNMSYHDSIAESLATHDLGTIATNLRAAIDPKTSNLGHLSKAYATYLQRASDKNTINSTASLDLSKDIMLSSWAKLNTYDLDFGFGIGKPEAVRRPQFTPVESLMYLMPKKQDGEIALALCLKDRDMEMLKQDHEFTGYGVYVA